MRALNYELTATLREIIGAAYVSPHVHHPCELVAELVAELLDCSFEDAMQFVEEARNLTL